MTDKTNEMATLAGWLEENCGEIQAQYIIDHITRMQRRGSPLECLEIMLLADLIHGYRKEMLRQIKEFKALRKQENSSSLTSVRIYRKLKDMKDQICQGIECWTTLRDDYFLQRACYMEHYRRKKEGFMPKEETTKEEALSQKRIKKCA